MFVCVHKCTIEIGEKELFTMYLAKMQFAIRAPISHSTRDTLTVFSKIFFPIFAITYLHCCCCCLCVWFICVCVCLCVSISIFCYNLDYSFSLVRTLFDVCMASTSSWCVHFCMELFAVDFRFFFLLIHNNFYFVCSYLLWSKFHWIHMYDAVKDSSLLYLPFQYISITCMTSE